MNQSHKATPDDDGGAPTFRVSGSVMFEARPTLPTPSPRETVARVKSMNRPDISSEEDGRERQQYIMPISGA